MPTRMNCVRRLYHPDTRSIAALYQSSMFWRAALGSSPDASISGSRADLSGDAGSAAALCLNCWTRLRPILIGNALPGPEFPGGVVADAPLELLRAPG